MGFIHAIWGDVDFVYPRDDFCATQPVPVVQKGSQEKSVPFSPAKPHGFCYVGKGRVLLPRIALSGRFGRTSQ